MKNSTLIVGGIAGYLLYSYSKAKKVATLPSVSSDSPLIFTGRTPRVNPEAPIVNNSSVVNNSQGIAVGEYNPSMPVTERTVAAINYVQTGSTGGGGVNALQSILNSFTDWIDRIKTTDEDPPQITGVIDVSGSGYNS